MKNTLLLFILLFSLPVLAIDYGIDRLDEAEVARMLENKNLAVLTHAAGVNRSGEHLIDLLFRRYQLKVIFAPEHGLRTMADDYVGDGVDERTNLPVISLYKQGSRAPRASDLAGIDAIVIDLQDVGVRYYTYFATIAEVMKAAAPLNVEVVILDRPNIQGGDIIEGRLLDPTFAGRFTAYHTVPTRHGMTLGELALMVNAENKMKTKLTIIPARNWNRERLVPGFDRNWVAPSPALPEPEQAGLYALWGNLESLNIAVGRGQTNELGFRVMGAPWMSEAEAHTLSTSLNVLGFEGMEFSPFSWKVTRAKYEGQLARGVRLHWNGHAIRSDEFSYKLASVLLKLFPDRIGTDKFAVPSFGSKTVVEAIKKGRPWEEVKAVIDREVAAFKQRRLPYLLY